MQYQPKVETPRVDIRQNIVHLRFEVELLQDGSGKQKHPVLGQGFSQTNPTTRTKRHQPVKNKP